MRYLKSPYWLLLMSATFLLFGFNLYSTVIARNTLWNDFSLYGRIIYQIKSDCTITTPHFIYPLLVAVASEIFPRISYPVLGASVILLFQLILAHVLWRFWKLSIPEGLPDYVVVALTLAAMTVAPVSILTLWRHNAYLGYIGITVYHNPPILICRPVALLNFLLFANGIANRNISARQIILCSVTLVIATLMKPNYGIIMVPAAAILACLALSKKDFRLLRFIFFGAVLPGFLVLAGQFLFTYISPNSNIGISRILFAPFLVLGTMSRFLFPKFILSILFPLCVLIVFWRQATSDKYYMIGLLLFFIGAAQSYFLAEDGPRMYYGNFLWSGQLGLFLWIVASMRVVLKKIFADPGRWMPKSKRIAIYVSFSLHVASGLIWYVLETSAPWSFW